MMMWLSIWTMVGIVVFSPTLLDPKFNKDMQKIYDRATITPPWIKMVLYAFVIIVVVIGWPYIIISKFRRRTS